MAGKKQPNWLHKAISWGASVVIIGALFKILHLGGIWGSYMIGAGLTIEAFLFFLTGFFPPDPEPAWDRVYPQLKDNYDGPAVQSAVPVAISGGASASSGLFDAMLSEGKVGPELIESLGAGLRNFGDKVTAISSVTDASLATNDFTAKVQVATSGISNLNDSFEKVTRDLAKLGESNVDSKAYHEQVTSLAKNLSALNAVYELELQDSSAHLKAMNKFYQNLASTMQNFNESMEDSKQFKEEVGRLAKNLSSLNSIYGNMLSAMNAPRV